MEKDIDTKSEAVIYADEAKVEVEGVVAQQGGAVLEVCLSNPSSWLSFLWLIALQALHGHHHGHRLRVFGAILMGDSCHHLSVLPLERWPIFNGLWGYPCRLWGHCDRAITWRDGFDVRFLANRLFIPGAHFPFSSDPMVGAQYRWSAHFAPCAPRFWGLLQGWLTVGAWMFGTAGAPAGLANMVTGLIIFNKPNYVHHSWHTAMLMWLFIIVPLIFNRWFRKLVNPFEAVGAIVHVVFFIVSIATLAVLAKPSTPGYVFGTLVNDISGWTNPAVSWGIGLLTVTFPVVGKMHTWMLWWTKPTVNSR